MVSRFGALQVLTLFITCSLVVQHFVVFAASRPLKICAPPKDLDEKMASGQHTARKTANSVLNRYKKLEDAFRPTSPGHSPGIGHPP
ncbi:hypothetical protein DCAR_0935903 [Daucus carota subsp. sativus]|uniref:Uncharacterized protein n=1 Tax=Daucus carota subsp. sativus TaxID=79200 RepID=A0A175YI50_DAUCS|nr:hypothetical protein DCAR_0935903 [Daucus carota subsp. sativus]